MIDDLTYTYSGNQLTRVDDATGNAAGFSNGASTTNEYVYDNNGNLTKDSNKGITNITYNVLNLPSTVTFSDGSTITYSYAADGTKLRTVHTISGTTTQKDYCGNVVYENGSQKLLVTEEGYVDLSASTPTYYYYLKDHQGNNRVVINSSGTVQETNHYYPFGGVFASTGNVQPYKYNGKELDTKKGLNWYDYGARHYDATLGRWFVVDPLAEKYYSSSPFVYCGNNPINYIDFNGMSYDGYTIDENGLMERVNDEGHNLYDVIYNKKNYSSEDRLDYDISGNKTGIKINKGIVKRNVDESRGISNNYAHRGVKFQKQDLEGYPIGKEISVHVYEVASDIESLAIMNFMDKNTNVEWGNTLIEKSSGEYRNLLITSHEHDKVSGNTYLIDKFLQKTDGVVVRADHIHPRNTTFQHSDGDRQSAGTILKRSPNAKFRILFNGKYYSY